jgi:hypothetical protein
MLISIMLVEACLQDVEEVRHGVPCCKMQSVDQQTDVRGSSSARLGRHAFRYGALRNSVARASRYIAIARGTYVDQSTRCMARARSRHAREHATTCTYTESLGSCRTTQERTPHSLQRAWQRVPLCTRLTIQNFSLGQVSCRLSCHEPLHAGASRNAPCCTRLCASDLVLSCATQQRTLCTSVSQLWALINETVQPAQQLDFGQCELARLVTPSSWNVSEWPAI